MIRNLLKGPKQIHFNFKLSFFKTNFPPLSEKPDFPAEEEKILDYWEKIKAFENQLEKTKGKKMYTFYDGPPFATGLPHYGHICAGTIKDVVTRYASQSGYHVERKFGWDCHGLPVEYEIDKKFNIKSKEDVQKMGIANYNKECRAIVMRYSSEWRKTVKRMGRWIDFDNDYKTMDLSYMESCWYVFKQMYEKGLVYLGCKVMPYSNACNTVLSNFEADLNYKEINDPSLYLLFPLKNDSTTKLLIWTTTPWTLPANLAVAVHPNLTYLKIMELEKNEQIILAESRLIELFPDPSKYKIIDKMSGKELEGIEYVPPFEFIKNLKSTDEITQNLSKCFKVYSASFVSSDTGTGLVHCAPAYGEDDYKLCLDKKLILPSYPFDLLDSNGKYLKSFLNENKWLAGKMDLGKLAGVYIKDAENLIKNELKEKGMIFKQEQIRHSYPFCWRSDTPLIYRATQAWFIKVTSLKPALLKNNKKAYWVPSYAQEGRFSRWLENAEDWCFSRNRSWGNPIPLWVSDDGKEVVCVGSIEELKTLSGVKEVKDLHREFIDGLKIISTKTGKTLHRIEEVFDCWFESGSMPFAQLHYPFSLTPSSFRTRFPADFIGEGLDQTRGWFYTLNVIATALMDESPYRNLIVNGLVLAGDGKKMSKRLGNYTPPDEVFRKFGADAVRVYLMNSPLVRAEPFSFKDEGVKSVVKEVLLPIYNVMRFLVQNVGRWEDAMKKEFRLKELPPLIPSIFDKWIVSQFNSLVELIQKEMSLYRLYNVIPPLLTFLDSLSNWYIRLNRSRLRGDRSDSEWTCSLAISLDVLVKLSILIAPFAPFISELIYKTISKVTDRSMESVHFEMINELIKHSTERSTHSNEFSYESSSERSNEKGNNEGRRTADEVNRIEEQGKGIERMMRIIEVGRNLREKGRVSLKQPLQNITIIHKSQDYIDSLKELEEYIKEELNCEQVTYSQAISDYLSYSIVPNHQELGKKLKEKYNKDLISKIQNLSQKEIEEIRASQAKNQIKNKELQTEIYNNRNSKEVNNINIPTKDHINSACNEIQIKIGSVSIDPNDLIIKENYLNKSDEGILVSGCGVQSFCVLLDTNLNEQLRGQGIVREIVNKIQKARKTAGLRIEDEILIFIKVLDAKKVNIIDNTKDNKLDEAQNKQSSNKDNQIDPKINKNQTKRLNKSQSQPKLDKKEVKTIKSKDDHVSSLNLINLIQVQRENIQSTLKRPILGFGYRQAHLKSISLFEVEVEEERILVEICYEDILINAEIIKHLNEIEKLRVAEILRKVGKDKKFSSLSEEDANYLKPLSSIDEIILDPGKLDFYQ